MKLPRCEYPDPKCCGAQATQNTFRHLWYALDGRLDLYNIDQSMFGSGLAVASQGSKVGANAIEKSAKQLFWLYAPGMGNLPRFEEDCSKAYADRGGLAVVVRDGKSFEIVEESKVQGCAWTPAYKLEPDVGLYLYYGTYYGKIAQTAITADRTYTLPDQSGTIALTSDIDHEVVEQDGRQDAFTGTLTKTLIESITLTSAQMNTPGSKVRAEFYTTYTGGSVKTITLSLGGVDQFTLSIPAGTNSVMIRWTLMFATAGAPGVVYYTCDVLGAVNGESYQLIDTTTVDTTVSRDIGIYCTLANTGDSMTLQSYVVEAV